ncbi:glutamyl-tRNA reductase [Kushneria phosphatilytica]|uniref:Glutamyl-tRNA reductase n=1 Tax=Kushneria phosphatilytica TaxID=657387 RepID=A0A1S1P1C5_9GAMM|nr:glutamyl-tRNA reductase [Kushneria phosphatilytica]OHV12285.1 glutamyl-tRNA reductase [Kushneria phosphatilytica]QEL11489.1 glutamyl-tRNA reductase [Kushneria phosphatilytica]
MLLVLGINHTTAEIAVREQVAFGSAQLGVALDELRSLPSVLEASILSTCNRTELYCVLHGGSEQTVLDWLAGFHRLPIEALRECTYHYREGEAARHMMRVACGLDSMVLGEPQILGQLKEAYHRAREQQSLGSDLERLFQHTFAVAKQVRSETGIGENPVSVAYAAVNLAGRIFDDIRRSRALLIGAGETIELVARHLKKAGIQGIIVANRTRERAQALADEVDGVAIGLDELQSALVCADVVISSTGSPMPMLGKGMVETALKARKHRPVFMVDIAVPRDIEPQVGELDDIFLYTIDDLNEVISENRRSRESAAAQAEEIIVSNVSAWQHERRIRGAGDLIRRHRQQAEGVREEAEAQALAQLAQGQDPETVIRRLSQQLTNRLLHGTTLRLREASGAQRQDLVAAAEELLLDAPTPALESERTPS